MKGRPAKDGDQALDGVLQGRDLGPSMKGRPAKDGDWG